MEMPQSLHKEVTQISVIYLAFLSPGDSKFSQRFNLLMRLHTF